MAYETESVELPPVTDWVNDWDWLDESNSVRNNPAPRECAGSLIVTFGRIARPSS